MYVFKWKGETVNKTVNTVKIIIRYFALWITQSALKDMKSKKKDPKLFFKAEIMVIVDPVHHLY